MKIQIVSPVFNESDGVAQFCEAVQHVFLGSKHTVDIYLVDDGSTDDSWEQIRALASADSHVRGIRLARNFGKDGAIFAGLSEADDSYDASIVLDSDLQHPPQDIPRLIEGFESGADLVVMRKTSRPDQNAFIRWGAQSWGKTITALTGVDITDTTDFRLVSARLRAQITDHVHAQSFFRLDSGQFGFRQEFLDFSPESRKSGKSSFSVPKLANLAMRTITSASTKPLQLVTLGAVIMILLGAVLGVQTLINWFMGNPASGFTTVILLILVLGGIQLLGMGIFGLYIGSIVDSIRKKPAFMIEEIVER